MWCAEQFEGYMSALAWVKQAYKRPICAEFGQPKQSWKDRRSDRWWCMKHEPVRVLLPASANMCMLTHPPTFTGAQLSPAGSKGSFTKTPPSRLCFPKYLWHTHTLTHSEAACGDSLLSSADSVLWQQQFTHYPAGNWDHALHSEDAGIGFSLLNRNSLLSGQSDGSMPRSGSERLVLEQFKGHPVNIQIDPYASW